MLVLIHNNSSILLYFELPNKETLRFLSQIISKLLKGKENTNEFWKLSNLICNNASFHTIKKNLFLPKFIATKHYNKWEENLRKVAQSKSCLFGC